MGRWQYSMLALLGGCGRLDFAPRTDAAVDGPTADACAFGPWSSPQRLAALSSSADDWGGQISADGLDYYFASNRSGNFDLYESHRTDRSQSFASVAPMMGVNAGGLEDDVSVTPDGLEVYFDSDRGPSCIHHGSRTLKTDPFSNVAALPLCGSMLATGSYVTPDGLSFYYNLGVSYGSPWGTLMVTTRATTADPFSAGTALASLQSGELKGFPALSADQLTMFFETASPDHHLWQATRTDRASDFANVIMVPGINDTDIDEDASITADGLELYFASRRTGTGGFADIFVSTRSCL